MGQNKLNKKEGTSKQASNNPNDKNHKGDTERSSDQVRKSASGGSKETNNQGHRKEA